MKTLDRIQNDLGLKMIRRISHEDVFKQWAENEALDPGWIHCATEIKGWDSWHDWRGHTISILQADIREWYQLLILFTVVFFRQMLVGPFGGWQETLPQKNLLTFQQALETPLFYQKFRENPKVLSLMEDFPLKTTIMGLYREDLRQVVCLEGHHRITAAVFAAHQGKPIDFIKREVFINLFILPASECALFERMLARGTTKIPPR